MNEWIECFECNARYERVVPPLLEMQKNADQTLRGPAEDCEIAVSALTAAEQDELEEQAHCKEEMQAALDHQQEVASELQGTVREEREAALLEALELQETCETMFGKGVWAQVLTGGDPLDPAAVATTKAQAEEDMQQAQSEFSRDRTADWQTFGALGRQDVVTTLGLRLQPLLFEPVAVPHSAFEISDAGATDVVDTLLSLLSRTDGMLIQCGVETMHQLALHEAWRPHLSPVVEMLLQILAAEPAPHTLQCALVLRLLASERTCRDAIRTGLFNVKQWWQRPLASQEGAIRDAVACSLIRVAADKASTSLQQEGGESPREEEGADPPPKDGAVKLPEWVQRAAFIMTRVPPETCSIGMQPGDVTALVQLLHGRLGVPVVNHLLVTLFQYTQTDGGEQCYEEALRTPGGVDSLAGLLRHRLPAQTRTRVAKDLALACGALEEASAELATCKQRQTDAEAAKDKMAALVVREPGFVQVRNVRKPDSLEQLCEEVRYMAGKVAALKPGANADLEAEFERKKKELEQLDAECWQRVWLVTSEGMTALWEHVDATNGVCSGDVELLDLAGCSVAEAVDVPVMEASAGSESSRSSTPQGLPSAALDAGDEGADADQPSAKPGGRAAKLRATVSAVRAAQPRGSRAAAAAAADAALEQAATGDSRVGPQKGLRATVSGMRAATKLMGAAEDEETKRRKEEERILKERQAEERRLARLKELLHVEPQNSGCLFEISVPSVTSRGHLSGPMRIFPSRAAFEYSPVAVPLSPAGGGHRAYPSGRASGGAAAHANRAPRTPASTAHSFHAGGRVRRRAKARPGVGLRCSQAKRHGRGCWLASLGG